MAHLGAGEDLRRGGILQSGLGLAALGVGAALVGAFVVGPVLKAKEVPEPARRAIAEARHTKFDELPGEDEIRGEIDRAASHARRHVVDEVERAIAEPKRSKKAVEADAAAKSEEKSEEKSDAERDEERSPVRVHETTEADERAPKAKAERREREEPADRPAEEVVSEPAPRRTVAPAAAPAAAPRSPRASDRTPLATPVPAAALRPARPESRERTQTTSSTTKSSSREAGAPAPTAAAAPAAMGGPVYRIRTGQFESRTAADETRARLAATGIPATVVKHGDGYTVLAGSYKQKENADRVVDLLRQQQLGAEITVR